MCKYCDGSRQLNMYSETGLRAEIEMQYGNPYLIAYTTIDAGFFGCEDIEGKVIIKYCPMCGEKLIDEEEN